MPTATFTLSKPRPIAKEGDRIWLKFHKNPSKRRLAFVRKIDLGFEETTLCITPASHKERDNYKAKTMIKRLKTNQ